MDKYAFSFEVNFNEENYRLKYSKEEKFGVVYFSIIEADSDSNAFQFSTHDFSYNLNSNKISHTIIEDPLKLSFRKEVIKTILAKEGLDDTLI